MISQQTDGVNHINVYSKGYTELGRFLSNFTRCTITTEDGRFESVEGYWYWLGNQRPEMIGLSGVNAKKIGRTFPKVNILNDDEFKRKIREACWVKIHTSPRMLDVFKESVLPFKHYYVFGGETKYAGYEWLMEMWEYFRAYIKNGYKPIDAAATNERPMKFFVTERGDVSYQIDAAETKLRQLYNPGDALLAISKNVTCPSLRAFLIRHRQYTIFHATITGYGGTDTEPGVMSYKASMVALNNLILEGFPPSHIVLRVDPIIPTEDGIALAWRVIEACPTQINRIRFSFIDGYDNAKRIIPWTSFHAPKEYIDRAMDMLLYANKIRGGSIEACGEDTLKQNVGCISSIDYGILNLPVPTIDTKNQRKGCKCLANKTELLSKPLHCPNGCVYCYYRLGK